MKNLIEIYGKKRKVMRSNNEYITFLGINYDISHKDVVTVDNNHYHKNSPFIIFSYIENKFILLKDSIFLSDIKSYTNKNIKYLNISFKKAIDGKYYLNENIVTINGKHFYIKDNSIYFNPITKSYHIKIGNEVPLSENIYGKDYFSSLDIGVPIIELFDEKGFYARESDSFRQITSDNKILFLSKVHKEDFKSAFVGFVNDVPDFSRLKRGYVITSDLDSFIYFDKIDKYVHKDDFKKIVKLHHEWYINTYSTEIKDRVYIANSNYSEVGKDENNPEMLNVNFSTVGLMGGHIIKDYRNEIVSKFARSLGGMKYSFGVEIETSNGGVWSSDLRKCKLASITDGSISGAEYITSVLHGDKGVANLKSVCNVISLSSLVDDRCGVHIHIGGLDHPNVWKPKFTRLFAFFAIKLGVQIEDDMFRMMPTSRKPSSRYLKSIKQFSDINFSNWKEKIGNFVFEHKIDRYHNSNTELGEWTHGRYKWMNLVNCNSLSDIKTIEFRIFGATTSFEKILNYVRISMAIVWFIENRHRMILNERLTLIDVINEAYKRKPLIAKEIIDFYNNRVKRFNRTDI